MFEVFVFLTFVGERIVGFWLFEAENIPQMRLKGSSHKEEHNYKNSISPMRYKSSSHWEHNKKKIISQKIVSIEHVE